jgi:hypothetical protein
LCGVGRTISEGLSDDYVLLCDNGPADGRAAKRAAIAAPSRYMRVARFGFHGDPLVALIETLQTMNTQRAGP